MSFIIDLPGAAVKLYSVIRSDRELQDWLKLILSSVFSGVIALTGIWGGALVIHTAPWIAFGMGLCAGAVAVFTVLMRMPQGRSLMVVVPTQVEQQYEAAGQTVEEPVTKK
jgi:hypothetical protein